MSDIIEILGEKKFAGSKNSDIKTSVVLEETKQTRYDNNLFYTISQQTQFLSEKRNCNDFRVYGKINPIYSLDVNKKTTNGFVKATIDKKIFDLNLTNWSIVILKSKQIINGNDPNNNPVYAKGIKHLQKFDINQKNKLIFNLDLNQGLPARTYNSKIYTDNFGLYFPLGHNFSVGDKIKIDSNNDLKLKDGFYTVEIVDGSNIYINKPPFLNTFTRSDIRTNRVAVTDLPLLLEANTVPAAVTENNNSLNVRNLTFFGDENLKPNLSVKRPKIAPFLYPEFYVTKIIEKEALEYYIKVLEVIDVIDEVDNCGFSKNFLNQQIKSYFLNHNLNLANYTNNKGEPLTDIYIGIIKNGSPDINSFKTVESHFNDFIDHVSDYDGLELINDTAIKLNQKTKIGDTFYYSICEHTTEELTETELTPIYHRFIHGDVLFNYKPFYKIKLKLKSPYIEDSDGKYSDIPTYAIYSRQKEKYIWRDIFDIGVSDENGNVIDFPYMNDGLYVFNQINFFIRSEKIATKQYKLNSNDITNLNGNQLNDSTNDILNDLNIDENQNNGAKPYKEYKDVKC